MDLRTVNLNLLLALDVLLEVRGVGAAARRLGVTQSAMSHSLRQLRELFDDPLLVREGHRMVPTPRAEALAPSLRDALRTIESVVESPEAFDSLRRLANVHGRDPRWMGLRLRAAAPSGDAARSAAGDAGARPTRQ